MKKFILASIIVLIVIVAFTVFRSSQEKTPQTADVVKIGYKKSVPSFPIFVGINEGFFKNKNIEIEPVVFESTNQMIEAVVRGDIDASAVGAVEPALAAEAVSPGNFKFYGQVQWNKDNFLDYVLVKKDSTISTVQQLKGKKIGVAPGGASVVYTKLFLKNFLNPDEVRIEQLDNKTLIQALGAGSIDAIIGNEPLGTIAIQQGVAKVLLERPYTDYVLYLPEITGVGLLSKKFIEQQADIAERFVEAMKEGFVYGNANPENVKKILPSCCGVSEEVAPLIPYLGLYFDSKSINKEVLQRFADFLFEQKILDKKVDTGSLVY
ncbi:MAG: ABC transporter substrate-binding protein [Patescibacteria group bacterium]